MPTRKTAANAAVFLRLWVVFLNGGVVAAEREEKMCIQADAHLYLLAAFKNLNISISIATPHHSVGSANTIAIIRSQPAPSCSYSIFSIWLNGTIVLHPTSRQGSSSPNSSIDTAAP